MRDYGGFTFVYLKPDNGYRFMLVAGDYPLWSKSSFHKQDIKDLHDAWLEEEKRRNTPLDSDGWTHLKNVGEHTSGYHYIRQDVSNDWFNVFAPDGNFFVSRSPLEDVIDACNDHAKKNGVKSC